MLTEQLAGQRALLLLDNCEHLLSEVADVVSRLLRSTESTVVLATSREPLSVGGETVWRIPVLSLPDEDSVDAVRASGAGEMFSERAHAADQSFVIDETNVAQVARVCRRLDGLPLAIELACARLRSMSLGDLDRRLDDRFKVLRGGATDEVAHHRTLRDTVAWSYDLLSDAEKQLYRQLSVFGGGFDLDAAEAVDPAPRWSVPDARNDSPVRRRAAPRARRVTSRQCRPSPVDAGPHQDRCSTARGQGSAVVDDEIQVGDRQYSGRAVVGTRS